MRCRFVGKNPLQSFGGEFWCMGHRGLVGAVSDEESLAALHKAIDCGVNFIDTADVLWRWAKRAPDRKTPKRAGRTKSSLRQGWRRLPQQTVEGYNRENLTAWVEESLRNLSTDALDLLQLHCPLAGSTTGPTYSASSTTWCERGKFGTTVSALKR